MQEHGTGVLCRLQAPRIVVFWDIENVRLPSNCDATVVVEAVRQHAQSKLPSGLGNDSVEPSIFVAINKKA